MTGESTKGGRGATERPGCLRCRRVSAHPCPKCGGPTESKGWRGNRYCHACRVPRGIHPERPCCVACRRQMDTGPNGYFRCRACGTYAHATKTPRAVLMASRPFCAMHGRPMQKDRARFRCDDCVRERRAELVAARERRELDAARLLATVTARLPRYLAPDEREDAAQSIVLDILTGELSPTGLTPRALRSYAARARGMVRDTFSFISLSAPAGDRRTLGDMLEG